VFRHLNRFAGHAIKRPIRDAPRNPVNPKLVGMLRSRRCVS
jgi:hypothetical protein